MLKTKTFILPSYLASYLINGDASSLTNNELRGIQKFMKERKLFNCIDCSEEEWFARSNDINTLGGNVMEFTFEVGE